MNVHKLIRNNINLKIKDFDRILNNLYDLFNKRSELYERKKGMRKIEDCILLNLYSSFNI